MNIIPVVAIEGRPILSLRKFCQQAGISDTTAWRWRRNAWLVTVNIAGKPYLTDSALAEFLRRVEAGEFAKEPRVTRRL
jgi:predicted site-specific integrase-resolvase